MQEEQRQTALEERERKETRKWYRETTGMLPVRESSRKCGMEI